MVSSKGTEFTDWFTQVIQIYWSKKKYQALSIYSRRTYSYINSDDCPYYNTIDLINSQQTSF